MFDHAQSPRLGQKTAPENPGIRSFVGIEIPEASYHGAMIYRADRKVIQVYDSELEAWEDAVGGQENQLTFVQATTPVARSIGDQWYDTSVTPRVLKSWDGDSWELGAIEFSPSSVLRNSNMEEMTVENNVAQSDQFAGWSGYDGTWDFISQETTSPLSGTRSLKITLPTSADSKQVISEIPVPVVPGQIWSVSAQLKLNRQVDTSNTEDVTAALRFHTSDGTTSPSSADNGTSVIWQIVDALNLVEENTLVVLEGDVVVPPGHRLMQISLYSGASADGLGYTAIWDEVNALASNQQINIINDLGEITASITKDGDAVFHDITHSGSFYANPDGFFYGGQLFSSLVSSLPRGRLSKITRTFIDPLSTTTTEISMYATDLQLTEDRSIDFVWNALFESSTSTSQRYDLRCRYNYSATTTPEAATTSSTELFSYRTATSGNIGNDSGVAVAIPVKLDAGFYRFLFTFRNGGGSGSIQAFGTHTVSINDQGPKHDGNSGYWPTDAGGPGQNSEPQQYIKTYDTYIGREWTNNQDPWVSDGNNLTFGNDAATSVGNRRVVLWFHEDIIRADLIGATVDQVELYLYKSEGGSNTIIKIGTHTDIVGRQFFTNIEGKVYNRFTSDPWPDNVGQWVNLDFDLQDWKTSLAGIVIYPQGFDSDKYSGTIKGATHSLKPKLRITYTK
jgi:hypothetical protein